MPNSWTSSTFAWACAGVLLLVLLSAGCSTLRGPRPSPPPPVPDRVDRYGGLELVTHTRSGAAAENNGLTTLQQWSLRWQGQPLLIDTMTGMWSDQPTRTGTINAVYVLGAGDAADLLVNVGDPNNAGAYHLLHQHDGQLDAPLICPIQAGDGNVIPLGPRDGADDAQREPPGGFGGPRHQRLVHARWLLLGQRCVLDVAARRALKLPQWTYDGTNDRPSVWPAVPLHDVSPDGRSLVRFGAQRRGDDDVHLLIVADLEGQQLSTLPIARDRMRYDSHHTLDNAWLYHHFEWQRGADGRYRLHERRNVKPLPWRGTLASDDREYRLQSVQRDPSAVMADFLVRHFRAQPQSLEPGEEGYRFVVRGEQVTVRLASLWVGRGGSFWPGQPGDPELAKALAREIAQAFDAELATGRHDALFAPSPATR